MATAINIKSSLTHPWEVQLAACRQTRLPLCVFDVTNALKAMQKNSKLKEARRVFDTAIVTAEWCEGIAVIDSNLDQIQSLNAHRTTDSSFADFFKKILLGSTIPQLEAFGVALTQATTRQLSCELTALNPKVALTIRFIEFKELHNQSFLLASIEEASAIVEQKARLHQFESILENMTEFVTVIGLNGEIDYWNPSAQAMTGFAKHTNKMTVRDIFTPASVVTILSASEALTSGKKNWHGTIDVTASDIDILSLQCHISPLYAANTNALTGFTLIGRQATTEEHLRREVAIRDRVIEDSGQMVTLGQISGQVIHEINNPMTIIAGKAEKILRFAKANPSDVTTFIDCAEKILKMTKRTEKIISSVKSLAYKSQTNGKAKVSIRQLVDDLRDLIDVGRRKSEAEIRLPEIPNALCVRADALKLSQVLVNLFGNSYDAIADLSDRWVELKIEADASWIAMKVIDSGNAIPQNVTSKLFDAYFTTKDVGKGTGIGLNLSRQIARRFGGDLYLDEKADHTTFVLTLPLIQDPDSDQSGDWEEI